MLSHHKAFSFTEELADALLALEPSKPADGTSLQTKAQVHSPASPPTPMRGSSDAETQPGMAVSSGPLGGSAAGSGTASEPGVSTGALELQLAATAQELAETSQELQQAKAELTRAGGPREEGEPAGGCLGLVPTPTPAGMRFVMHCS